MTDAPKPLVTPECTASYPFLFQSRLPPNAKPGAKPRYSIALLVPKGADISALKKAVFDCAIAKWGQAKVEALLKDRKLGTPFRTDLASKGYDDAEYQCFMQPWSHHAPGVVSRYRDSKTGKAAVITDPNAIYAGCKVIASVRPFAYEESGNRGVAFGLQNVQFRGDGERIDGRRSAADEFEADAEEAPLLAGAADPLAAGGNDLAALLGG